MLFLTGDCHGDFCRFSTRKFPARRQRTTSLTDFLQYALEHLDYGQWFCGHYHRSEHIPEHGFWVLNEEIIQIDENEGGHHDARQQKTS